MLITGGAGFIGPAVTEELDARGCEVFILDNLSFGTREHVLVPDERFVEGDILNPADVARALEVSQPEWVIHLAAIHFIPYCNQHPYESSNINLQGTLNVLDGIKQAPSVKKVFFASTAAVYADSPTPVAESAPTVPLDIYGLTKWIGERFIQDFSAATGIPCVIGRLFNAYGPRETNPHLIPEIQKQILNGVRDLQLGNIATRRDYIHTSDMARAIHGLMAREHAGVEVCNIGTGSSFNAREIVAFFEAASGDEFRITVASDRVRKQDRALLQADVSKLRAAIGWEPQVVIADGIAALLDPACPK